ncbi:hypothetical protein ACOSP7_021609 [Xanthoceras sorbifolium]
MHLCKATNVISVRMGSTSCKLNAIRSWFAWTHCVSQGLPLWCSKLMRVAISGTVTNWNILVWSNIVYIGHTSPSRVCFRICNPKYVYTLRSEKASKDIGGCVTFKS